MPSTAMDTLPVATIIHFVQKFTPEESKLYATPTKLDQIGVYPRTTPRICLAMPPPMLITADEINCLVYSYLQDSGFQHSAFALRMEGHLEHSPHFAKHIPRGELVELLSKALLYVEVESHWKGDTLDSHCKTAFSLLEPHVCSLDQKPPTKPKPPPPNMTNILSEGDSLLNQANGAIDGKNSKSRSNTLDDDERPTKRVRMDSEYMDVDDAVSESKTKDVKLRASGSLTPSVSSNSSKIPKRTRDESEEDLEDSPGVRRFRGHRTEIFVCAWNPAQPGLLATGSKDGIVHIWKVPDHPGDMPPPPVKVSYFTREEAADLTAMDWNVDGTLLAIGSYDTMLRIVSPTGSLYFSHPQHMGPIFATRFSKSGRWLLTASLDGTACVWDIKDRRLYKQYRCHQDCCLDVAWLDESMFASCGADSLIQIMHLNESKPIKTLSGHEGEINEIICNSSHTRLASCSDDRTSRIWNVADASNRSPDSIPGLIASDGVVVLKGHTQAVSGIDWCSEPPFGRNELVATASFDSTTRLWDSVTGACLHVFSDHKRPIYALSFSPPGRLLATGSGDGWLHVYDVKDKRKLWSWFAGYDRPGVFEVDWQQSGKLNRIAMALECRVACVADVDQIPALQSHS